MERFEKGCRAGWTKYEGNPVLGGELGTCFDMSVVKEEDGYRMYFSWRPMKTVAVVFSRDGLHWDQPVKCLQPRTSEQGWEDELNRPAVVKKDGRYHMWYTGQFKPGMADGTSHIFYAVGEDGVHFERIRDTPVICPEHSWEKSAVMCPDVRWDEKQEIYQMWYSAGEQYEPTAIGYAKSRDGINWKKYKGNPVFQADLASKWEQHKAAGCHVERTQEGYLMFYIGYHNEDYAQIGLARSENGITDWERHPCNPIIAPEDGQFDEDACYKPYAIWDGRKWILWYNGRTGHLEQIGAAFHEGKELWATV